MIFARSRLRPLAGVVVALALAGPAATAAAADRSAGTAAASSPTSDPTGDGAAGPPRDAGLDAARDPSALDAEVAGARAQAQAAGTAVSALTARLREAQTAYGRAVAGVGSQASVTWTAVERARELERSVTRVADERAGTARALYMGGGSEGLASSLLDADDPADLAGRLVAVRRLLERSSQMQAQTEADTRRAQQAAEAADAAGSQAVVTVALVGERAARLDSLLAAAQGRLDALSARSRALSQAQAAARALAAARAAVAAQQLLVRQSVTAVAPPADFFSLYHAAALTCPGMPWQLLAAVGQIESGHGRDNGPSSAGAIGPMQFMPATFAAYAVDGDRDGLADPWAPADSVYTAARYLCSNGAGSPAGLQRALLAYNHAQWYVDLVLGAMAGY